MYMLKIRGGLLGLMFGADGPVCLAFKAKHTKGSKYVNYNTMGLIISFAPSITMEASDRVIALFII